MAKISQLIPSCGKSFKVYSMVLDIKGILFNLYKNSTIDTTHNNMGIIIILTK